MTQNRTVRANHKMVSLLASVFIALAVSLPAEAHKNKHGKGKKGHGKGKPRVSLCVPRMNGRYKLKSFRLRVALRKLSMDDSIKEPITGPDGNESCEFVGPPATDCIFAINGVDTTIEEHMATVDFGSLFYLNAPNGCFISELSTGANYVELYNSANGQTPSITLSDTTGQSLVFPIESETQYNACSLDITTYYSASATCSNY